MSYPMDPNDMEDGPTEWDWGPGMFPPGIANGEGQHNRQDDFGAHMHPPTTGFGDKDDNYARAVADRRTDPTNADSGRNFNDYGNPDRFGPQPPLVQAPPSPDQSQNPDRFGPRPRRLRRER